jgi:hypothetical protein
LDGPKSAGGDLRMHPGMVQNELDRAGIGAATGANTAELDIAGFSARSRFEGALFMMKSTPNGRRARAGVQHSG